MKRCIKTFEAGCLHLTHGKIITSLTDPAIVAQETGSLKAIFSQNGRNLGQVPYSGYTGNVSRLLTIHTISQADGFLNLGFRSGRRKECHLVRYFTGISVLRTKHV